MPDISNSDDIIDVRDIIAQIEDLESELQDAAPEDRDFNDWAKEVATDDARPTIADAAAEYLILTSLLDDLKGYGGDEQWRGDWYPLTLVRGSYFTDYARDLAEDIGAVDNSASWPNYCIDWEWAAKDLKADYSTVEYDGVTYWYR